MLRPLSDWSHEWRFQLIYGIWSKILWFLDVIYYKSSGFIKCKDGSKNFTKAQLNDDFCDCLDGTDEPGFVSRVLHIPCSNSG